MLLHLSATTTTTTATSSTTNDDKQRFISQLTVRVDFPRKEKKKKRKKKRKEKKRKNDKSSGFFLLPRQHDSENYHLLHHRVISGWVQRTVTTRPSNSAEGATTKCVSAFASVSPCLGDTSVCTASMRLLRQVVRPSSYATKTKRM